MSKSYRIRTEVGKDKYLNVELEQDFESLEILSLKLLQSEIYNRMCSDYGVVIGRVTANNGLGLPNCKISVFIPITDEDETNPIISELYPYKSLNDINDEGYRYNLLPYKQSHGGHTPTGTFPTRQDVLINPSLIEVYDKYYKYTVKTNESGDYMIFGVPLGSQTIHIDIDLSDIGEFSLSPQDLIRLGIATEKQFDGINFRSSTNLNELPQIIQINRIIDVLPFWGDEDSCNIGLIRTDFDITQEFSIKIEPTAIFMGSIFSNPDERNVKKSCKPNRKLGNQCLLTTGPGEILSIRQTINYDNQGRPILEEFKLEDGGKCIDENGTWLIDVPMNLDYVTTNEFGERTISQDPNIGVPTKGKYRFKIIWTEPSGGGVQRADFLVPNIKEWGWNNFEDDPTYSNNTDYFRCDNPQNFNSDEYKMARASYSFSLNWDDYGPPSSNPNYNAMIGEAINCDDRFYIMKYNNVYTVSQLLTEFRKSRGNKRVIQVRDILDDTCEGVINKFPTNDGNRQSDILYILFLILAQILFPTLLTIVYILHIISLIICILVPIVGLIKLIVGLIKGAFCGLANLSICLLKACISPFGFLNGICNSLTNAYEKLENVYNDLKDKCNGFDLKLPIMFYPECEMCNCDEPGETEVDSGAGGATNAIASLNAALQSGGGSAVLSSFMDTSKYKQCGDNNNNHDAVAIALSGFYSKSSDRVLFNRGVVPALDGTGSPNFWYNMSLPIYEKLNLFNLKSKYFDEIFGGQSFTFGQSNQPNNTTINPGGGVNRIKVKFNYLDTANSNSFHYDNIMVLSVGDENSFEFKQGQLVSFVQNSSDVNLNLFSANTQFGTKSLTGTCYGCAVVPGNPSAFTKTVNVSYAKTDNTGNDSVTYKIQASTAETSYHRFGADIEYFQVITGMTIAEYRLLSNQTSPNNYNTTDGDNETTSIRANLRERVINGRHQIMKFGKAGSYYAAWCSQECFDNSYAITENADKGLKTMDCFENYDKQKLIFLVRGVDPNTKRQPCSYDMSIIFGYQSFGQGPIITGNYKLNIPIQGKFKNIRHHYSNITNADNDGNYSGFNLFHKPYTFKLDSTLYSAYTTSATTFYSSIDSSNESFSSTKDDITQKYLIAPSGYEDVYQFNSGNVNKVNDAGVSITPQGLIVEYTTGDDTNRNFGVLMKGLNFISTPTTNNGVTFPTGPGLPLNGYSYYLQNYANYPYNFNRTDNNNGYFYNEIIEGGSLMIYYNRVIGGVSSYTSINLNRDPFLSTICTGGCGAGNYGYGTNFASAAVNYFTAMNPNNIFSSLNPSNGQPYFPKVYGAIYYSRKYVPTNTIYMSDSERIVMRSDRLPTSDQIDDGNGLSVPSTAYTHYDGFAYPMHSNTRFSVYEVSDDGSVSPVDSNSVGGYDQEESSNTALELFEDTSSWLSAPEGQVGISETLNCSGMVPLSCYEVNGEGQVFVKPTSDNCYYNGIGPNNDNNAITKNGCYQLVTFPILGMLKDFILLREWLLRLKLGFASCRNIFGHSFTNSWINGTLFMFPLEKQVRFTSPETGNKPYTCICKHVSFNDFITNNTYYRCAPYNGTQFFGRKTSLNGGYGDGNDYFYNFPTTIMNLGPRSIYAKELSLTNEFEGYIMDKLKTTSFQEVGDVLNFFLISRIVSQSWISTLITSFIQGNNSDPTSIYFKRPNNKINGDYAQMISINSEIGISYYNSEDYSSPSDVYITNANYRVNFGIFFKTDVPDGLQIRDWLTPHRLIVNQNVSSDNNCAFEELPIFSQNVPFYQWEIKQPEGVIGNDSDEDGRDSIFGGNKSDWYTSGDGILNNKYQSLDRNNPSFDYYQPGNTTQTKFSKGYIYGVDVNGNNYSYAEYNPPPDGNLDNKFLHGPPFHFYFGVLKGKSAYDRFLTKWTNTVINS